MADSRPALDPRERSAPEVATSTEQAWRAGSVVLAGVLLGVGAGWGAARLLGWPTAWPVAVGVVLGTAVAVVDLWFRYGGAAAEGGSRTSAAAAVRAGGRAGRPERRPVEDAP